MPTVDDRQVPVARAAERVPMGEAIGVTGLRQFSGYVREEFLVQLDGLKGRNTFEEMAKNDSTCGAVLFAIRNMLRSLEWRVVPSEASDARSIESAELVEGMLFKDMQQTWPEFIEACCSQFTYGFAIHEILWKKRKGLNASKPWMSSDFDNGLWAPRAFAPRSQKTIMRWIFDAEQNLIGFEQTPYTQGSIVVPIRRCLHFRTTAELDNPEGVSLLRTAYRSWYWLKRLQEIEGIGTERDLAGYPVLKVPGEMLDPSANADPSMRMARAGYEEFLRKVRRDQNEGVLLPSDRDDKGNPYYEFSLVSSGGTRALRIDESISRYQKDIARSVLADFIFLGADGGGSLALGRSKIAFFIEALKAYAQAITHQINEVAIQQIWRLNGFDMELMPRLEPGEIEKEDLAALGTYLGALNTAGFDLATDTELENHLRRAADLPDAPDRTQDDDFVEMPSGRAVRTTVPGFDADGNPIPPDEMVGGEPGPDGKPTPKKGEDEDESEALGKALRERFGLDLDRVIRAIEHG